MEETLKVTGVLSDPTRFHIYEYILKQAKDTTVQEVANLFHIHPNVARLHLSKLEEVKLVRSETKKTGKGGRPSRLYRLSDEVIQLSFPYRDYQLLANIAVQAIAKMGTEGEKLFEDSAYEYGAKYIKQYASRFSTAVEDASQGERLTILKEASASAGLLPAVNIKENGRAVFFEIHNCPFKETAFKQHEIICVMHNSFLKGMFDVLFDTVSVETYDNMALGCQTCTYCLSFTSKK